MLKGYWIPHLDVSNPAGFQAYRDTADAAHEHYGKSKLLARGGRCEVVEGKMRSRNVLREFGSFDEAQAFYRGPEYSRARPLRAPHSECDFLIVEGYDGVQPPHPSARRPRQPTARATGSRTPTSPIPRATRPTWRPTWCRSASSVRASWCVAAARR